MNEILFFVNSQRAEPSLMDCPLSRQPFCQDLGHPQESQMFRQPWEDKNFHSTNILSLGIPSRATFWDLDGK